MFNNICKYSLLIFTFLIVLSTQVFSQWTSAVVAVTGAVIDEVTKKPISVNIVIFDNTGKKINSTKSNASDSGYYFVTGLSSGKNYTFEISSDNYLKEIRTFSIPNTDKYLEISKDFSMMPNFIGAHIPFSVSPFEYNKTKIRFGASSALENFYSTLKNNPNVKFTILSFPDNNENNEHNLELTKQRANALLDYFIINGIEPSRMMIKESAVTDSKLAPPIEKMAKGKKYIGTTYIVINSL